VPIRVARGLDLFQSVALDEAVQSGENAIQKGHKFFWRCIGRTRHKGLYRELVDEAKSRLWVKLRSGDAFAESPFGPA
jgi:hypothetical protein